MVRRQDSPFGPPGLPSQQAEHKRLKCAVHQPHAKYFWEKGNFARLDQPAITPLSPFTAPTSLPIAFSVSVPVESILPRRPVHE